MSKQLFNNPDVSVFVKKVEDQNFEKKSAKIHPQALVCEFSAFANSSIEGGLIVLGVANDTTLEGIKHLSQKEINSLIQAQQHFCPLAQVEHKLFKISNNKGDEDHLLLFFVSYSSDKVIKNQRGEAWERIGDETCFMSQEKIRHMEFDKGQVDFERSLEAGVNLEELNQELLHNCISNWEKREGLSKKPTLENLVNLRNFGEERNGVLKINYAGILLFHDSPDKYISGARIRFLKYDGVIAETGERSNIIKDKYFTGPISIQVNEASLMIKSQIREFSFLDKNGKFTTVPEYPEFAWFEAIVNAVVHRAYNLKNNDIFIRMFSNRIEIASPGNLPSLVTEKNIYEQSSPRNPKLMQGMLFLGYVKNASEGMDRIKKEMELLGLPDPVINNNKEAVTFSITLLNNIENRKLHSESKELEKIDREIFGGLSDTKQKIIQFIAENKKASSGDVVGSLSLPRSTVNTNLQQLLESELIKKVDAEKGPNVKYKISGNLFIDNNNTKENESESRPKQSSLW